MPNEQLELILPLRKRPVESPYLNGQNLYAEQIGEAILDSRAKVPFDVILEEDTYYHAPKEYRHTFSTRFVSSNPKLRTFRRIDDTPCISELEPIEKERRTLFDVLSFLKTEYKTTFFKLGKRNIDDFEEDIRKDYYKANFTVRAKD